MDINRNSGQIEVISPYGRVYLYTHDTARNLLANVHNILSKESRWDDPDYLSRMLFCEMIPESFWSSDTGFGIGTQLYADVELLITLDTVNQKITVSSGLHEFDNFSMTFSEFIVDFLKGAKL
jgi:hypothetical protein